MDVMILAESGSQGPGEKMLDTGDRVCYTLPRLSGLMFLGLVVIRKTGSEMCRLCSKYMERSHSGLVRAPAKRLGIYYLPRVRIPPSPLIATPVSHNPLPTNI